MCDLEVFINNIYKYLTGEISNKCNIIRRHTKYLEKLGDISFPLNPKNWTHLLKESHGFHENDTIFNYLTPGNDVNEQINKLQEKSREWTIQIEKCTIDKGDVHLYLLRHQIFGKCIRDVLSCGEKYGSDYYKLSKNVQIDIDDDLDETSLTYLRLFILKTVTNNLTNFVCDNKSAKINMVLSTKPKNTNGILCGSILDEEGKKNIKITADQLYEKRKTDMQLMAQHKYGVQVKPSKEWNEYFEKLGRAAVTIEMLQNKSHKNIKISLNNVGLTNNNGSFIFYNCARLSTLFRKFNSLVMEEMYPNLPKIDDVDFTLLNEPEEWELVFVYILQFPLLIRDCINDVESGVINPHYIVAFLSKFSSIFSVYYRRIRILTKPRQHLFDILFARLYLLKAVEQVFHIALNLLGIQPIKEM